jgi:shikimate kinase
MPKIILIGFMGCGKTTLGKLLSQELNVPFFDTDALIEAKTNQPISKLFDVFGEAYFRQLEKESLEELTNEQKFVLATGGGLPCFGTNMDTLNELGQTVYLETSVDELYYRLSIQSTDRPLLNSSSLNELKVKINSLVRIREPFYQRCKHTLRTDGKSVQKLIETLVSLCKG